ncbi:hypothetical protein AKN87_01705 [Thiopseudomonas alkaliphila]|uniref:Uncharacterized protein n=1 Tax=Thiopseudomonas alkaliphila TaxID=1697053 RepID=A0A0K1XGC8_9GAMM|nr:hypothetical protein [Thiopseudomonas alkaliphila]AKX43966.1 hypothetical protein AKN87_01705 [Thiopseudomonas alkaliphila]AKX46222.1 hypothetical protein AKN94_01680 [Thiopseudomonas alkaliphila]AKX60450.1 hypothetical protein AKN88_11315 [Thiopseudomonas alkaliphila]
MTAITHVPLFAPTALTFIKQAVTEVFSKPVSQPAAAQPAPAVPSHESVAISYKRLLGQAVLAVNFQLDDGADFDHALSVISDRYNVCPDELRQSYNKHWSGKLIQIS